MITDLFCCPICGKGLTAQGGQYVCPSRHSFDIARQGYVNLLTGHAAQQHGDNKEMICARRDFLAVGYYQPLMDTVARAAVRNATPNCRILDAGCGECSYTHHIAGALQAAGLPATILGIDISREALAIGGRRDRTLSLAVASLYHLPLATGSIDLLFEIFAPYCEEEYQRVLRPGGRMVMVIPGKRHLFGLKTVLYPTPYENEVADTALPGFILQNQERLSYSITLHTDNDLWNLFTMTPYFYRTAPQRKELLRHAAPLETAIEFEILEYTRI